MSAQWDSCSTWPGCLDHDHSGGCWQPTSRILHEANTTPEHILRFGIEDAGRVRFPGLDHREIWTHVRAGFTIPVRVNVASPLGGTGSGDRIDHGNGGQLLQLVVLAGMLPLLSIPLGLQDTLNKLSLHPTEQVLSAGSHLLNIPLEQMAGVCPNTMRFRSTLSCASW